LRAIRIWEGYFGAKHTVVGLALSSYAKALLRLDRLAEAELVFARSQDIVGDFEGITAAEMADGMQFGTYQL